MIALIANLKQKTKFLKREATALYFAYRDPRTPWYARVFAALVVSYLLSPIDLIPDFIPVLGYLDDLVLVPLGVTLALKMIPKEVLVDARKSADNPQRSKGMAIIFSFIVLCIWVLLCFVVVRTIYQLLTKTK